ncbi:hypothetical protein JCM17846_24800 [Iodidimonas nitroreducens]|uniref:Lipoprotein n=1 Tax=Iodidimonas nitroreducens TaxID=1236968 RepID=A0A5A7N9M7_9PROT|nr:hypothetical protein [Iodidimonas nitroreducens]GAK33824.1 hypothetical protein AQ1_01715 [alpha proteobacterium Q-1]GER04798.1 hypothetical protein JCM17846_24800 [Iodidimonas nitroreducens]
MRRSVYGSTSFPISIFLLAFLVSGCSHSVYDLQPPEAVRATDAPVDSLSYEYAWQTCQEQFAQTRYGASGHRFAIADCLHRLGWDVVNKTDWVAGRI